MRTWIWKEETKLLFAYIIDHMEKGKEFTEKGQLQMIVKNNRCVTISRIIGGELLFSSLKSRVQSPALTKC